MSTEVEQLLGIMLLDKVSALEAITRLNVDDFESARHRTIFSACEGVFGEYGEISLVLLIERLKSSDELKRAGGAAYLALLSDVICTPSQVLGYCQLIKSKSKRRRLINLATTIRARCSADESVDDIMQDVGRQFFEIVADDPEGVSHVADNLDSVRQQLVQRCEEGLSGVATDFLDLDIRLAGLSKEKLYILAARPGMGKTALAMNFASNIAKRGEPVIFFSLEMGKDELIERQISTLMQVGSNEMRKGLLNDYSWKKIAEAEKIIKESNLYLDDTPGLSINELVAKAKMQSMSTKLSLVVVDYIQLVRGVGLNRDQEIGDITRRLKGLSKDLSVPVLAISQLNRGLEKRDNKRPKLSDLRESGSIEQDADVILFLYRDEIYNRDSPSKGLAEVIIGKHRAGPTGTVRLRSDLQFYRFLNLAREEQEF